MLGAFRACFQGQQQNEAAGGRRGASDDKRQPSTAPLTAAGPSTVPAAATLQPTASSSHAQLPATPNAAQRAAHGSEQHDHAGPATQHSAPVSTVPISPFAVAAVPAAHAAGAHAQGSQPARVNGTAVVPLLPMDVASSHCSSADSSLATAVAANGGQRQHPTRVPNGSQAQAPAYSAQALGPNVVGAATMSARPEELLMLGPLDNTNMGLMARPASLQLHQLNRQITNLQKIGQGAGGIVYKGLWTGVNVAIKFLRSSSPDQLNQTAKEAILSRFVSHPNVVQTYTYDVTLLVDSALALHHNSTVVPVIMPGIMEEDPEPPTPIRSTPDQLGQGPVGISSGPNTPGAAGVSGAAAATATAGMAAAGVASVPDVRVVGEGDAGASGIAEEAAAEALRIAEASTALQQPVQTTPSLAIFDMCSKSTVDVRASLVSQPDMDSMAGVTGWDMQDVLLRLGAQPGEYLTHIIMELCEAGTLQQAIAQGLFGGSKETSADRAKCRALLKTAREVAGGMQHLHSLGIIHGDLKPGNVLLRKDGSAMTKTGFTAKVGDFGLAQRVIPGAPELQAGVPLGTLSYAAPEALRGLLLKTSDVYSFGVMLWQMCSGDQPFKGMHPAQILYGKQTGTLKLTWPSEVYSPIRKLGELCTETDPAARPHFDQICKALVQIEQRLQKVVKAASSLTPTSSVQAAVPGPPVHVEQQQVVYELMPDPEILA